MKLLAVLDRSRAVSGELLDFKMAEEAMAAVNSNWEQLGASLPSNKEPLLTLASQASQRSSAWQQPVRHKPASIEATFTPMAAGIRAEQVPASMGDIILEAIKKGIAAFFYAMVAPCCLHFPWGQ